MDCGHLPPTISESSLSTRNPEIFMMIPEEKVSKLLG
jgi:hypothetical protein